MNDCTSLQVSLALTSGSESTALFCRNMAQFTNTEPATATSSARTVFILNPVSPPMHERKAHDFLRIIW